MPRINEPKDDTLLQQLLDQLRSLLSSESSSADIERLVYDIAVLLDITANRHDIAIHLVNSKDVSLLLDEEKGIQARILAVRLLGQLTSSQAVDLLIYALDDPSWEVREAVAQEFGKQRNPAGVDPFIAKRFDRSWHVRRSIARALGLCGHARAVAPLIELLDDPDRDVRIAVIEALGNCGDTSAGQPLVSLLGGGDAQTQRTAAKSLTKLGSTIVELLLTSLPSLRKKTRTQVVRILGDIGDTRATKPLILMLSESDFNVRRAAAQALGKIGDADAVKPLITSLDDHYLSVRRSVIRSLGLIGDTRAVEPLLGIVREINSEIGFDAAEALARIGVSQELISSVHRAQKPSPSSAHDGYFEEQHRAIVSSP